MPVTSGGRGQLSACKEQSGHYSQSPVKKKEGKEELRLLKAPVSQSRVSTFF